MAVKGCALCRALHLHKTTLTGHGHVHVGVTVGVLCVVEVQNGRALIDAHRDSSHLRMQCRTQSIGLVLGASLTGQHRDGIEGCQPGTRDACRASAAIGLQHIAVQGDRSLAQGFQIADRSEGPSNEPLDLQGAPTLLAPGRLTITPSVCGSWQHAVFRSHPSAALPLHKARHLLFHRGCAQHVSISKADEDRALCMLGVAALQSHRS